MAAHVIIPVSRDSEELAERLAELKRPSGVDKPRITFGTDHSGDKSVWIVFPVSTKIKLTKSRVIALDNFAEVVRERLRLLHLEEIPYVRFTETSRNVVGI